VTTSALAGLAAIALAGAVAGYVLMAHAPQSPWTVLAMLGPMAIVTFAWLWRSKRRAWGLSLLALLAVAAWGVRHGRISAESLYVAQHAGIHAALAAWFASTLGTVPLIVRVARRVHAMTPPMVAYATSVTRAWVIYFVAMAVVSVALYLLAPFPAWNVFATVLTPLSLVAMFVGEHKLRYALHPEFERVRMRDAIRAWRQPSRLPQDPPAPSRAER
jgi:uncharacterized membrane protein